MESYTFTLSSPTFQLALIISKFSKGRNWSHIRKTTAAIRWRASHASRDATQELTDPMLVANRRGHNSHEHYTQA